jgi:hypothetical protein
MLLGSWLEGRLGAKMRLDGSAESDSVCPQKVELNVGGYELKLEAPAAHIVVHVTTPEHCYLPFKVPTSRAREGDLLAAAIDIG